MKRRRDGRANDRFNRTNFLQVSIGQARDFRVQLGISNRRCRLLHDGNYRAEIAVDITRLFVSFSASWFAAS
jgi:hypothetical protein